jgi:hypothetical protein
MALDQVTARSGCTKQRAAVRAVYLFGEPGAEILQERRPGVLARTDEKGIGVKGSYRGRRYVQPAQADIGALAPVVIMIS